jgi:hypothetical protein
MNIIIVVFLAKEYSDIEMRSGYNIPHTREHLNIMNIVMRRILIHGTSIFSGTGFMHSTTVHSMSTIDLFRPG